MSSIITFYSYKGGVGRSMALANIALLLARQGHRVLAVDWDLEAPGLDQYFSHSAIEMQGRGLLPMLIDSSRGMEVDYRSYTWRVPSGTGLPISLLASGRDQNADYSSNLEQFDWKLFFLNDNGGSIIEKLRARWREDFDFVLIDSRTGLSDAGGVCTIQLPDIVVAMFTANHQSLYGVRDIMRLAQHARQALAHDRMSLTVLPLPSRFGTNTEYREGQEWLDRFEEALHEFFDDWLPSDIRARHVLEQIKIPQVDYFGFGEKLAVIEGGASDPAGMAYAYQKVAGLIASNFADIDSIVGPVEKAQAESLESRVEWNTVSRLSATDDYQFDLFVSYPHRPEVFEWLREFVKIVSFYYEQASGVSLKVFLDLQQVSVRGGLSGQPEKILAHSKLLLEVVSPIYVSDAGIVERQTFELRQQLTGKTLIVSIVLRVGEADDRLNQIQALDLQAFPIEMLDFRSSRRSVQYLQLERQAGRLAELIYKLSREAPPFQHWLEPELLKPSPEYDDFVLGFDLRQDGAFTVQVLDSPAGEGEGVFRLTRRPEEWAQVHLNVSPASRDFAATEEASVSSFPAKEVGGELFGALFSGSIGRLYDQCRSLTGVKKRGLRLKFRYRRDSRRRQLALVHNLPWELLYDPRHAEFLALSRSTPIVRSLEVRERVASVTRPAVLRVLVVISRPVDLQSLGQPSEIGFSANAWGGDTAVEVEILEHAQVRTLREKLLRGPVHCLHFMGHKDLDPTTGKTRFFFESSDGCSNPVSWETIATLLKDAESLRLVFLNSCERARPLATHETEALNVTAAALVMGGVPAVLLMQCSFSDSATIDFSRAVHQRLVAGDAIESAVAAGRRTVYAYHRAMEWAIPVLFSSVRDGHLFTAPQAHKATHIEKSQEVSIAGSWLADISFPGGERNSHYLTLHQDGTEVTGETTCVEGYSKGNRYQMRGTFRARIFACTYTINDELRFEQGAMTQPAGAIILRTSARSEPAWECEWARGGGLPQPGWLEESRTGARCFAGPGNRF